MEYPTLSAYETSTIVHALSNLGSEFRDEARELWGFGDRAASAKAMDRDSDIQNLIKRIKRV